MNVGVIFMAIVILAAASFAALGMISANEAPMVDTFGSTTSLQTNQTHQQLINDTAPIIEASGGLDLALAIICIAGLLFSCLALILYNRRSNSGYGNR